MTSYFGFTNRGARRILDILFRGDATPANFNVALCTAAVAPSQSTTTLSQLTQIAAGNGYSSGGLALARNTTDWPSVTENANYGAVVAKNLVWTASGGPIPASGGGALYAVLTDANSTIGSREVWGWWDLGVARMVSNGQQLQILSPEVRIMTSVSGYAGWTSRGARRALGAVFRAESIATPYYVALCTAASTPSATTATLSQLTQIATGNGYSSGGLSLQRNTSDWSAAVEDGVAKNARSVAGDRVWLASGGPVPASGAGASRAVLTTHHATVGSREVWLYAIFASALTATVGQELRASAYTALLNTGVSL